MAQTSIPPTIYTFYDVPPPSPLLREEPELRCDVCDQLIPGPPAGEGLYLWTRGDERRYEPAPLCEECATAIGIASLRRMAEEEEEGS
ncbi:MAG: hypothetical protein RMJ98_18240 [Myxococcales bacterium]|nr:hypothetical protein [Polyangiaceae bacterium]MDW8251239.1 hypothetical protein [Myxococcales bacterium]